MINLISGINRLCLTIFGQNEYKDVLNGLLDVLDHGISINYFQLYANVVKDDLF